MPLRPRRRERAAVGPSRARLRAALFLAVGMAMTGFALVAYATNLMRPLELDSVDARFALRGVQATPADVVVVEIDATSFAALEERWPFRRTLHAQIVDRLREAGARTVAYDVQFTEPSLELEDDYVLAEAIARAGNVVLATTEVDVNGDTGVLGGEAVLRQIKARAGNAGLPPDPGGVIRRLAFDVDGLESFAVATVEVAQRRQLEPLGGNGTAWIDFRGPPGTIQSVSFSSVLRNEVPHEMFRDRIVVVGPSAPSLQDVHPTSTARDELMAGAELQANAVWTVLHGYPLDSAPQWLVLALIGAFGFLAPVASLRVSFVTTVVLALTVGVAFTVATQVAFERGIVLPFTYPLGALVLSTVGAIGTYYSVAAFERERVRDVFSRFVPEQVVGQVLARTDRDLRLGGVDVVGSIMFTDLRGFTSFSENIEASQAIDVVNVYLEEMTDAVLANGGTLISFAGDGIMAVYGAPIEQPDHADRALATAREMIGTRLPRFNAYLRERGLGDGFRMGIGIHSGAFVAGNVGSERRLEYTIIGDTVNTASRIEGLTKGTRHMCLFSEATKVLMQHPPEADFVFYEDHEIRGRQGTIALWSLESISDPVAAPAPAQAPEQASAQAPAQAPAPGAVPGSAPVAAPGQPSPADEVPEARPGIASL